MRGEAPFPFMPEAQLSGFSLAGILVYIGVAMAAFAAGLRFPGAHRRHWLAVSTLFLGLAVWRAGAGEAHVQQWARAAAEMSGHYQDRRSWQGPLAAAGVLLVSWLVATSCLRGQDRLAPPAHLARGAALLLAAYSGLRLLSYHPVDAVIYAKIGPVNVNHLIDIGLSALCGMCALMAWRRPSGREAKRF